jgi:uncharacterized protein (TIGR00251 family)
LEKFEIQKGVHRKLMGIPPDWQKIINGCDQGVRLQVKITPGSSRTRILGPHGDCLKIAVSAPPEKGKANQSVIEFLSERVGLPRQKIQVVSGPTSPRKVILLTGVSPDSVYLAVQKEPEK